MPERSSGGLAGDLLAVSWQVAVAVGAPLFGAAWLSQSVTQDAGTQLAIVLGGLAVAGLGMLVVIRRYIALNPIPPTSDAARDAGRRWEQEIRERETRKETEEQR